MRLAELTVREVEAAATGQRVFLPTNPRLFGDGRRQAAGAVQGSPWGFQAGLDSLFEVSGAGGARVEEVRRRAEVARAELAVARTRVQAEAWKAWIDVAVAQALVQSYEQALTIQARVEAATRERERLGAIAEPDLLAVAVESASVRAQLEEARRDRDQAEFVLRRLVDWPPDNPLRVPDLEPELRAVPSDAELVAKAMERRPELAAIRAGLALLTTTDDRLVREAFPKVGVSAGVDGAPASPPFGFVGLAVELPVAQRNQGPRAVVAARRVLDEARLDLERARVALEVRAAARSYALRHERHGVLAREAVPRAERLEALVESGWAAGRFELFRLTAATRDLVRVRRERLEALRAAWADYVELQRVSGGLGT